MTLWLILSLLLTLRLILLTLTLALVSGSLAVELGQLLVVGPVAHRVLLQLLLLPPLVVLEMKPELVHDLGAGEDDVEDDGGDHSGDEAVLVVVQLVVLVRKVDEPVEAHEPPNNWKNCMF